MWDVQGKEVWPHKLTPSTSVHDLELLAPYVRSCSRFHALTLRYITEHLKRSEGIMLNNNNVKWCLTVPAMWVDKAKSKMRQAAKLAGKRV